MFPVDTLTPLPMLTNVCVYIHTNTLHMRICILTLVFLMGSYSYHYVISHFYSIYHRHLTILNHEEVF